MQWETGPGKVPRGGILEGALAAAAPPSGCTCQLASRSPSGCAAPQRKPLPESLNMIQALQPAGPHLEELLGLAWVAAQRAQRRLQHRLPRQPQRLPVLLATWAKRRVGWGVEGGS